MLHTSSTDRMAASVREKILRVREALRLQSVRIQQLLDRMSHRGIVIENAYGIQLCRHRIGPPYLPPWR